MPESLMIDGLGPLPVVRPTTVEEVCALVQEHRGRGEGVYTVGGRTMLDFGLPPTKPGIALETTALNQIIDYPHRDMTITVQAGTPFAKLQATLAEHNQWLPLDVPDPQRMTLGGIIACNIAGPRRLGYGTIRDYLIGISFVSDDGVVVKGGGRVVKNVAGYDLMKLHIGALGTIGVITQVTLKVRPRPEACQIIDIPVMGDLDQQLDLLARSASQPSAIGMNSSHIVVAFEGAEKTIAHQGKTLKNELTIFDINITELQGDEPLKKLTRLQLAPEEDHLPSRFLVEYYLTPSTTADFLMQQRQRVPHHVSEPLNGIVRILTNELDDLALTTPRVVRRAPTEWKTPERVFGQPTPAFELMRHIKRTLDPDGVFNPGRMF